MNALEIFYTGIYFKILIETNTDIADAIQKSRRTLWNPDYFIISFLEKKHINPPEEYLHYCGEETLYKNITNETSKENKNKLKYSIFPRNSYSDSNLLLQNIAEYAFEESRKKEPTHLYYILLGLLVRDYWRFQYCVCCNWRVVPLLHGRKRCPACSYQKGGSTNRSRIQKAIFNKVKNSPEYIAFMKERKFGEHQLLLRALGIITHHENFSFDREDYTDVPEYRLSKTRLAALWNKHTPKDHSVEREENRRALIDLARQGRSKAEVARQLGVQRSTVTKICQKDPAINALFLASKQKRPAV